MCRVVLFRRRWLAALVPYRVLMALCVKIASTATLLASVVRTAWRAGSKVHSIGAAAPRR